jgi:23S rRNA (cytidine1920-2'-O)/16S rRNA (cytidine1409-2'-O)-methyltransferase
LVSAKKNRIDRLLVERGLFDSRAKAQAAIAAGRVTANAEPVRKASEEIAVDAALSATPAHPYVSRGGVKLAAALDHFGFNPKGRVCLDVGASTGGFTQVLLERGARRVYAIDVGRAQLHESLRGRPEVISFEETDIRACTPARFRETPNFVAIDVSFISLKLVLPPALKLVAHRTQVVALIKPQFEVGKGQVGKGGIVRQPELHRAACEKVERAVREIGFETAIVESPIAGAEGNKEFLLYARH